MLCDLFSWFWFFWFSVFPLSLKHLINPCNVVFFCLKLSCSWDKLNINIANLFRSYSLVFQIQQQIYVQDKKMKRHVPPASQKMILFPERAPVHTLPTGSNLPPLPYTSPSLCLKGFLENYSACLARFPIGNAFYSLHPSSALLTLYCCLSL